MAFKFLFKCVICFLFYQLMPKTCVTIPYHTVQVCYHPMLSLQCTQCISMLPGSSETADFINHPPARLKSRHPIWSMDTTGVTDDLWRDAWVSASVVNHGLVPDRAVRPSGFDLPRHPWTLLNRFQTGHGTCLASLHRWGMAQSDLCQCGQRPMMTHISDDHPRTKCDGGLEALYEADNDAVHWLQTTATKAFAK